MRSLLVVLIAAAAQVSAAITVSSVTATKVSHGSALISFSAANPTPNGDGTLWNFARICWSTTAGNCASKPGGGYTIMATTYPANAGSVTLRQQSGFSIILTGLTPGSTIEACPELSNDKSTWSAEACTTFTTPSLPAIHPVLAELPRALTLPVVPTDYTGFHSGASVDDGSGPGKVTACANLNADYRAAVNSQASYGTVISLAPGQANKCQGRFFPIGNPPDVHEFDMGNVSTGTNRITWNGHGLNNGDRVQFSTKYRRLPGEITSLAKDCKGLKPGQVYYAANVTTNDFQLSCDAPITSGGKLMQFADVGSSSGGGAMYVAKYPRRKDQGGALYPIVIRTATPDSQLPPSGTRLDGPTWETKLAVIQPDANARCGGTICFNSDVGFAMRTFAFATGDISDDNHRYMDANIWGIGLEIQSIDATGDNSASPNPTANLIQFREGTSDNGLDRCYIHGQYPFPSRLAQGIEWEGHNNAIMNSYFDRITFPFYNNGDSAPINTEGTQFIVADRGPGPYYFYNNFFQSTGNGFHFQAAGDNGFDTKIIQDVVIRRNTLTQNPPTNHQQYCSGNAGSDGWNYRNRQPLEFKGGYRALLDGNIFEYDCHWLASSTLALTSVTGGISDITITNNTWRHVSSVAMMGSCTQGGFPVCQAPTNRYTYKNNLIWDVDGFKYIDHMSSAWPGGWRGWVIQTAEDGEDFIWDHNTVVTNVGANPAMFFLASGGAEGFQFSNSIFQANSDTNGTGNGARIDSPVQPDEATACTGPIAGGNYAEALISCSWRYPGAQVSGNLATSDALTNSQLMAVWPTQKTTATPSNLDLVGWTQRDYTKPVDFHLLSTSPYISGGASHSGDGLDQGANIDVLEKAQGKVVLISAVPASTTATVNFVAPDTQACPVDVSSSDTTLVTTFTRFADSGSSAGPRSVSLTGLTAHTNYYFRVNCAVEQPTGTFRTN